MSVNKYYYYLVASATIKLYADVTFDGRSVRINSTWQGFSGSFAMLGGYSTSIPVPTAYDPSYAVCETQGNFTLTIPSVGDYYSRSYDFQMQVDPAGAAYLNVLY